MGAVDKPGLAEGLRAISETLATAAAAAGQGPWSQKGLEALLGACADQFWASAAESGVAQLRSAADAERTSPWWSGLGSRAGVMARGKAGPKAGRKGAPTSRPQSPKSAGEECARRSSAAYSGLLPAGQTLWPKPEDQVRTNRMK